ncbi:MAG: lysophospholipid acyltransferase family protein [Candidatus Omnitrophica bacterium]|nr:lysophospholipid acyltransferase family protein [Candidatus Omnitrophota bacterium]
MLNYLLYRIGQFIALAVPLNIGYAIAGFIADVRGMVAREDKKAVTGNLKTIFPEKSDNEIEKLRIQMFRNFSKYLVDFFRFQKLNKDFIEKNVRIENSCFLDEAIAKGKGVIILTAHLGNWELGGVVAALSGYSLWVVALPHKDKQVDDFFNSQRQSKGIYVIPLGKAVRKCLTVLNEKKILALVGDRDFTEKGALLDFFGRKSIFPEGPAAFTLKTGASIIPGFMLRNQDDSFTLRFEKAISHKQTTNTQKDVEEIIGRYITTFEDYIRKYPDQWYMFRRFWVS